MIILSISDYPAPSDERSQIQVLSEEKGEISQKIGNIAGSRLDRETKKAVTNSLKARQSAIDSNIRRKCAEKDYKEKLDAKRRENETLEKDRLEKQEEDTARFDIRA